MRWLFAQLVVAILSVTALPAVAAPIRQVHMVFDRMNRDYLLYVPDSLARHPGPRPLVMVLHGGGGTAREVRNSTHHRFDALAEANGFVVVYPDAIGRIWDTGSGEISDGLTPRRDDLGFLKAVVTQLEAELPIDRSRIFATGLSRGGHASYMLGCESGGMFRAIAPVSMTLPAAMAAACAKGPPLGGLLIEGTADPIVPYDGGRVTVLHRARDTVLSVAATMTLFAARDGCGAAAPMAATGAVQRDAWRGCTAPVRLDRVVGGGHSWPSGLDVLPHWIVGKTNTDIVAADEIWGFFSQF
ncbi:MAG: hypothetical protein GC186_20275 [Rhodobacteraceae bacterium]|nr:hypothetical protein [Paracoccaceae bacterium]